MSTVEGRPTTTRCEKLSGESVRLGGFAALAIVNGELQITKGDGERLRLVEGDALLLGPGASCAARAHAMPCEVLRLEADAAWTEAMLHLSSGAPLEWPTDAVSVWRAASPGARRVRQVLRELLLPHRPDQEPGALHRTRAVVELLALAIDASASALPPTGPSQAGGASRIAFLSALEALREGAALDELSLRGFAGSLGLSERQVSRLFRTELRTTFCAYMTQLRVERARLLLEESALPVIQIAAESGWSSLAHFNSVFRRMTGRTPTAYRTSSLRAPQ
jgi:AraC-like DNA-binding protein